MSILSPRFDSSNSPRSPLFSLESFEDTDLDKRIQNFITTRSKDDDSESSSSFSSSSSALSSNTPSSSSSSSDVFTFDIPNEFSPDLLHSQEGDSEKRSRKRKRKEESDLEKTIDIVAAIEKEVHNYDIQIELLKMQRQQKINEHNQASMHLHHQALKQGKFLVPRHILSPEDHLSLTTQQVFNSYLIALRQLNSHSVVTSIGGRA